MLSDVLITRTRHIDMTTIQLFVRIENHLSPSQSSSIKSHRDQCKACRETMPAEQNFTLLKKCRFNTKTELMEALLVKRLRPFFKQKTLSLTRSEVTSTRVSLRGAVLNDATLVNSVQYRNIKFIFGFADLFCSDEVTKKGQKASALFLFMLVFVVLIPICLVK